MAKRVVAGWVLIIMQAMSVIPLAVGETTAPPISGPPGFIGALIGRHLFGLIGVILFATALSRRGRGHARGNPRVGFMIGIVILLVSVGLYVDAGMKAQREWAESPSVLSEMRDDLERYLAGEWPSNTNDDDYGSSDGPSKNTDTDVEQMHQLIRRVMADTVKLDQQYQAELVDSGWFSLVSLEWLSDNPDFARARKILARTSAITERYRRRQIALQEGIDERIDELDISRSAKVSTRKAFSQTRDQGIEMVRKLSELDRQVFAQIDDIISILEEERNAWSFADGRVWFDNSERGAILEERFNDAVVEIDKLEDKQRKIHAEARQRMRGILDKAEERVKW